MNLSVTAPIERAFERTRRVLFENFDATKWFTLGFCAWLANMGEELGSNALGQISDGGSTSEGIRWMEEHAGTLLLIVFAALFVATAAVLLMSWLRARGVFMFLDGIIHNRGAVSEPWTRFRERANRLFVAHAALGLCATFLLVVPSALGLAIAWDDLARDRFEGGAIMGLMVATFGTMIPLLLIKLAGWLLRNFVAPTMYLRDESVMDAWRRVYRDVIRTNLGTIALYFLMRILIAMGVAALMCGMFCVTFCAVAIPYIGTVILLPLFVFERSYGLYFLEQFGDDWRFFPPEESPTEPPAAELV